MSALKIGDPVIFLADRALYGPGIYVESTEAGLMVVEFADGSREQFLPHELDTPDRAYLTTTP